MDVSPSLSVWYIVWSCKTAPSLVHLTVVGGEPVDVQFRVKSEVLLILKEVTVGAPRDIHSNTYNGLISTYQD